MRRCRLSLILGSLLALSILATPTEAATRPNVIFIFSDDHAAHAISAYGSRINQTPNIDRLAHQGMLFRNNFCTNSICGPSRAVILTGKHSHLNGFRTNADRFNGAQETFPKLLRAAGYQTAVIGKWHLVSDPTGFDHWQVLIGQGPYYNPPIKTAGGTTRHEGYTTEIITELGLQWLREGRDPSKPFFLMLQHKAPHREWQPGPDQLDLYDGETIPEPATLFDDWRGRTSAAAEQEMTVARHFSRRDLKLDAPPGLDPEQLAKWHAAYDPRNEAFEKAELTGRDLVRWNYQRYVKDYLRVVAGVDVSVGRVLDHLEDAGLAGDTVVIYSSDQGFYLGDHGWYDKRWMYEESLRMPLIVRWPGVTRPGSENRDLTQNLDFAPTFLEMCGVAPPSAMQGLSLVPLLRGERPASWRNSIYYHYYEFPGAHSVARHYGVRTDRHKLIKYYQIGEWELFDLEKDPDELRSVHDDPAYASIRAELEEELRRLQAIYVDLDPEAPFDRGEQIRIQKLAGDVPLEKVFAAAGTNAGKLPSLDPAEKPLTAGAFVTPSAASGVLVAQGGASFGYSLYLSDGRPTFAVRTENVLVKVEGRAIGIGARVHLAGTLDADGDLNLFVDGVRVATAPGLFITRRPADGLSLGRDSGSLVGNYSSELPLQGLLADLRIYWGALPDAEIAAWARN